MSKYGRFRRLSVLYSIEGKEGYEKLLTITITHEHQTFSNDVLDNYRIAQIYTVAKSFNEIYPNIKNNLFIYDINKDSEMTIMEIMKGRTGRYPDVFQPSDIVKVIKAGLAADLSYFKNDPVYHKLNPAIMNMINY